GAFDRRGIRRVGEPPGPHLPASRGSDGARLRRLLAAVRRGPGIIPALLRQTERAAAGEAVHRAQHRVDPAGVQSPSDHDEAVSRRTGPYFQDTRGQQGDYRQYKAMGLAAADGAAYDGNGGVPVGGIAQRLLFAWYFNDVNLMLSNYITGDSRIMIRRGIQERVRTITPFLRLDNDPYLVISDGRLFWMQDTYTTSNYFPYAQPVKNFDLNYIRN